MLVEYLSIARAHVFARGSNPNQEKKAGYGIRAATCAPLDAE